MTESSRCLPKKHQDIISQLPSDILVSIISRLPLREATATSVLSKCWRYLHTYNTRLNFPAPCSRTLINDTEKLVDHVVDSHRGGRIKEFEVQVDCWKGANFDKWFEFALTKQAEIIHISSISCGGQSLPLSNKISLHGLKCLKELALFKIAIADHDFELLVSNCIALESLSIGFSFKLENVSIVGHSTLKHLDLSYVSKVGSIVLRDLINLASFKCYELRRECAVQVSNIPRLVKLDFKEDFLGLTFAELFVKMPPCIIHQLQLLHLSTSVGAFYPMAPDLFVLLVNIKRLELVLDMLHEPGSHFLVLLYCFIGSFPSLEKLVIKFLWEPYYTGSGKRVKAETFQPWIMEEFSPKCLKELEIRGYLGSLPELELASYVINYGLALEKLTVVACDLSETTRLNALARAHRHFPPIRSLDLSII